jgi:hypothetical protein
MRFVEVQKERPDRIENEMKNQNHFKGNDREGKLTSNRCAENEQMRFVRSTKKKRSHRIQYEIKN